MVNTINPRYPCTVIITRDEVDNTGTPVTDDNGDPVNETVMDSVCGLRNISEDDVNSGIAQTDIKLSVPRPKIIPLWKVKVNDTVTFSNSYTDEIIIGKVTKYRPNNLGIDLYFHKNG